MSKSAKAAAKGQPSLDDFLDKRDYMGALTLLEFKLRCQDGDMKDLLMWIGYCAFHLGNFHRAEEAYKELFQAYSVGEEIHLYQACCYFYQQMYVHICLSPSLCPSLCLTLTPSPFPTPSPSQVRGGGSVGSQGPGLGPQDTPAVQYRAPHWQRRVALSIPQPAEGPQGRSVVSCSSALLAQPFPGSH